jgi:hypothetical protein
MRILFFESLYSNVFSDEINRDFGNAVIDTKEFHWS